MAKVIVFDMDGTIADLYGYPNWLGCIESEDAQCYEFALPLVDMVELGTVLRKLQTIGYTIAVTSWLAMGSTKAYDEKVRAAKRAWLDAYDFPVDEIHLVKYGTTKAQCTRQHGLGQILFDDNAKVRAGWNLGEAYDVQDIIGVLNELLTGQIPADVI